MFSRLPCIVASALLAVLALPGCAGGDHTFAQQRGTIGPRPSERSDPGGTAVVAALDAVALGFEAFGPPEGRRSQPPTDDAFRQAARDADGYPGKK